MPRDARFSTILTKARAANPDVLDGAAPGRYPYVGALGSGADSTSSGHRWGRNQPQPSITARAGQHVGVEDGQQTSRVITDALCGDRWPAGS